MSINHKGSTTYTTKVGGFFGMITCGLIFYFIFGRLIKLIDKDDATRVQVTQGLSLLDDPTEYNFLESNFTIGIAAFSPDMSMAYDLRGLMDLKGSQIYYVNNDNDKMKVVPVATQYCEEDPSQMHSDFF